MVIHVNHNMRYTTVNFVTLDGRDVKERSCAADDDPERGFVILWENEELRTHFGKVRFEFTEYEPKADDTKDPPRNIRRHYISPEQS